MAFLCQLARSGRGALEMTGVGRAEESDYSSTAAHCMACASVLLSEGLELHSAAAQRRTSSSSGKRPRRELMSEWLAQ